MLAGEDMAEGKSLTAIKHTPPRSVSFLINIRVPVLSHFPLAIVLVMAKIRIAKAETEIYFSKEKGMKRLD